MATIDTRAGAQEPAAGLPCQNHPSLDRAGKASRPGVVKSQPAAETLRLYAGDWACFQAYCAPGGARALPASPDLVAAFLAAPGTGRAVLARRLAAIDHQHRQLGYPPPGIDAGVRAALRQARRTAPRQTRPPRRPRPRSPALPAPAAAMSPANATAPCCCCSRPGWAAARSWRCRPSSFAFPNPGSR